MEPGTASTIRIEKSVEKDALEAQREASLNRRGIKEVKKIFDKIPWLAKEKN